MSRIYRNTGNRYGPGVIRQIRELRDAGADSCAVAHAAEILRVLNEPGAQIRSRGSIIEIRIRRDGLMLVLTVSARGAVSLVCSTDADTGTARPGRPGGPLSGAMSDVVSAARAALAAARSRCGG